MGYVSYTRPGTPTKPIRVDTRVAKINPRFRKGQVLGAQMTGYKGADINQAPGYSKSKGRKSVGSFKKGGKVKKTGMAKVHKGERVLNKKQTKKYEKARKKHFGM